MPDYSLEPRNRIYTQITDALARTFEDTFCTYRKNCVSPNLYVLGSPRPLLEEGKQYFSILIDGKGKEHLQDYMPGMIPAGIRLEDKEGNVIINDLFSLRKRLRTYPTVPIWGRAVLKEIVKAHIASLLEYRITPELFAAVEQRLPSALNTSVIAAIENEVVPETPPKKITDFINSLSHLLHNLEVYIGSAVWDIYAVDFSTERLVVDSLGDFRIWDWHRIKRAEEELLEEKIENGEIQP